MAEKMLVTQALDERDLLVNKISDKINNMMLVNTIKPNEEKTFESRVTRDEFAKEAERAFQQVMDLIARYERIDSAIVASNAATTIETSYGTYTVAGAISLRNRLKNRLENNFERALINNMESQYNGCMSTIDSKNKNLAATAENMRLSILGKDAKVKDDKPLAVVEAYVKENTTELVDPLNILKKLEDIKNKKSTLLSELDTQIKVSNATTFIEI